MKKIIYIIIGVAVIIAIAATLLMNKAKIQAKMNAEIKEAYYVAIVPASKQKLNEAITFIGTVNANNDVNVVSETAGRITSINYKVGDFKQAGSVLVTVDDELKQASYTLADANYQKAKKDFERYKSLLEQKSVTEGQFDQIKIAFVTAESQYTIAKRQLNDTKIKAPISGVITSKTVDLGAMLQNNTVIGNIVDISKLKVKVNVAEKDIFKLKVGDKVALTTDVYTGEKFEGRVETISAKGDEAHTYPVEVTVINNAKYPFKTGMFARVEFVSLKKEEALVIPRTAILGSIKEAKVYVIENGLAKLRSIVLGGEYSSSVEVISGVSENEQVVVSGQNTLVDGAKVTIIKQ